MGKGIAMARKYVKYTSASILNQVVQSLVLSHLEYCFMIWSSASQKELQKLQLAQNRAAMVVFHCSYRTNVTIMHKHLSWLTVKCLSFLERFYPQGILHF